MAEPLNGRNGDGASRGALRVAFTRGTRLEPSGTTALVELETDGHVVVDGQRLSAVLTDLGPPRARLVLGTDGQGTRAHQVLLESLPDSRRAAAGVRRLEVVVDGWRFELDVDSELRARLRERATSVRADAAKGGPSELRAIIPGRVVSVDVAEGDTVELGRRLLVLEAMKMQNELKAPRAATIVRVAVGPGQTVELGDLLLVIE